jgi:hypothetical protein
MMKTLDDFFVKAKREHPILNTELDELLLTIKSMDIGNKISEPFLVSLLERILKKSMKSSNPKLKFREMVRSISSIKTDVEGPVRPFIVIIVFIGFCLAAFLLYYGFNRLFG